MSATYFLIKQNPGEEFGRIWAFEDADARAERTREEIMGKINKDLPCPELLVLEKGEQLVLADDTKLLWGNMDDQVGASLGKFRDWVQALGSFTWESASLNMGPHSIVEQPTDPWPTVRELATRMRKKLDLNRHKGGREAWLKADVRWLDEALLAELKEMRQALWEGNAEACADECADVANYAMMIADWMLERAGLRENRRDALAPSPRPSPAPAGEGEERARPKYRPNKWI
jgi:NTP pyrophosphatase (non-canonical NTP hydrolase)